MSLAAPAFKRTLLTSARFIRPTTPRTLTPIYQPLHNSLRTFSATMGKQGVHNLKSKAEFEEAMQTKDTLMVLDCFATWCGPCKVIAPTVVK